MKKVFSILSAGAFCLLLTGCSKSVITPEDTEINGDLAGAFEIVDESYPIESDGDDCSVTIKVKRTDVTVPYVEDKVIALGKQPEGDDTQVQAGFGYTLYDESGKEIETVEASDNESYKEVKSLLTLNKGEEGEFTITFPKDLKPAKISMTTKAKVLSSGPLEFVGSIGKYGVKNFEAVFNFEKGEEKGKYQYLTSPAGAFLFFKGTNESYNLTSDKKEWKFSMSETNDAGGWCGSYEGTISLCRDNNKSPYYYKMEGQFTNFRFDKYNFTISSKPIGSDKENKGAE